MELPDIITGLPEAELPFASTEVKTSVVRSARIGGRSCILHGDAVARGTVFGGERGDDDCGRVGWLGLRRGRCIDREIQA